MDVLIAGAGPAGSRLAGNLAGKGLSVILVEKLAKASQNAFSSAVVPIDSIRSGLIPEESVSSYWKSWNIFDPQGIAHQWTNPQCLGAVLDFQKLRENLWQKAIDQGVIFLSGCYVKSALSTKDYVEVIIVGPHQEVMTKRVLFVVDATGHSRLLIGKKQRDSNFNGDKILIGSGIEWIIKVDINQFKRWDDRITFFLGSKWVKNGYAWIFPMADCKLKVGVCSLPPLDERKINYNQINLLALKNLISRFDMVDSPVTDKHGGIINSTINRREAHYSGRIIGVGDAVSTANLLGGEGIRHALLSADVLAPLLVKACKLSSNSNGYFLLLHKYQKQLSRKLGWRWAISNRLAKKTWWNLSDQKGDKRIQMLIKSLSLKASADEISALLFDYRFERYGFRLLPYLLMGWRGV